MNTKELRKEFPYLTADSIDSIRRAYKTERGARNRLFKRNEEEKAKCTAKYVVHLEIDLYWKESKMWGLCPHAEARWRNSDGSWNGDENAGSAGGCGYDKQSACVSEALNKVLTRNLYESRRKMSKKRKEDDKIPYGISSSPFRLYPTFDGGCGISCTIRSVAYIGGKMKQTVNAKNFDRFVVEFKSPRKKA